MKRILTLAIVTSLSMISAGCDDAGKASDKKDAAKSADSKTADSKSTASAGGDDAAVAQAWLACAACHGDTGAGDGAAAAALDPKPRNFADAAWQDKVDDAHLTKVILEGGTAVGLSPMMAPNPQLKDKPEVVAALVKKIRGFKK